MGFFEHRLELLERRLLFSAYNWQTVDISAGGYVDGIFYDPHNQNVIYARTDVGGLYKSVNDGGNWTQLLNWVGANTSSSGNGTQFQEFGVLSFAIDPENSNNLYAMVGLYSGTNGDVLYSTNAGATWNTTPLSFWVGGNEDGRGAGERIAVDPYDSNIILLGSNANGLWESTNAGQSFTQLSSLPTTAGINFVLFDPYGGTAGSPTQEIFVGETSTASGTNLFETTNGGTSFTEVTGTGSAPTAWMPNRAVLASDGNLYVAYANDQAPNEPTNGGIMRYNTSTGAWANISPVMPQASNGDDFGYCGIALDPNSSTTLVVTSLDRYAYDDAIWRTTNANASSPSWVALYDDALYQGYNATRNTTNAPYMASAGDGISNWASDVAIDPFNSAQIMHNFGGGIWATNDGTSTTTLTAPNSWYFPDNGLEMAGAYSLASSTGGTPLYSGLGDVGGFGHTTLTSSPEQGSFGGGTVTGVDYAGLAPNDMAAVTAAGTGLYSTNGGTTVTNFASAPPGILNYATSSDGTIALSANDQTMVWAPSNDGPYYSGNNGASWSASNLVASVSSITQSGGVPTVVTSAANSFAVGQYITITGATPSAYDGTYAIASIVNSTTFTYTDSNVTSSTTTPATGTITASLNGTVVSDKVNPNYFYYRTENSSDTTWTLYISSNGGESFTESAGGSMGNGNVTIVVNPYVAGQLWVSSYLGLYESTNFGASFNKIGGYYGINSIALGAPAPGESVPAIYIYGTPVGDTFQGIYRSDDGGNTWLLLNNVNEQWGVVGPLAADPNVFGRVYASTAGIRMGNPGTSLPSGWSDTDVNEPGNPGWATSSTTLSTGATVNQWNIVGGGAGFASSPISISSLSRTGGAATAVTTTASGLQIGQTITISGATNTAYDGTFVITGLYNTVAGLANHIGAATEFTFAIASGTDTASGTITATLDDQFNFAYQPLTGSNIVSAQLKSMTNADAGGGTPQAGVMYRASTNPADPFFAVVQPSTGGVDLEYRTTTDGSITTQTVSGVPVGSEYVKVVRNGSSFTGFYSSNGTAWTQIGSSVSIAAMPATANAGLMATAFYNPQLTDATFSNVVVITGPSVANAAAATPSPVTGNTTSLSVLGSDSAGQSSLTYIWAYNGSTGVTYTGATNGTYAAQNITAHFTQSGTYNFTVTITDPSGLTATSLVSLTVAQTPTGIAVSPSPLTLPVGSSRQYSASVTDQFGNLISSPAIGWSVTGAGNSINSNGNATLGSNPGSYTVTATDGTAQGTAMLVAENFAIPSGSTLNLTLGTAGAVTLSSSGGTLTASQNGVQISFTGIAAVAVTDSGSGDTLNFNGPIALPFSFNSAGSSIVNVSVGTLTIAGNPGGSVAIGTLSIGSGASASITPTGSSQTKLNLQVLSIASTGKLDLANNAVLISYGAGTDPRSTITGQITAGYNGGSWNGSGIISSTAQTAGAIYFLGCADSADPGNPAGLALGTLEIKYTYFGDANLDGKVDGSDYSRIDSAYLNHLTGWSNGDFNYDGAVNGSDYTLIDNAFNTQGAHLTASIASPNALLANTAVKKDKSLIQEQNAVMVPDIFNSTTAIALPGAIQRSVENDLVEKDKLDELSS